MINRSSGSSHIFAYFIYPSGKVEKKFNKVFFFSFFAFEKMDIIVDCYL